MKKKKSLFIDCSEAGYCCDKKQYDEASLSEKIKMLLHMVFCRPCRKYASKNSKLTGLIRKSNIKSCPEIEKKIWKKTIENEMSK